MKRKLLPIAFLLGSAAAFGQTTRMVFVEEFTQASCGPCASANPSFTKLLVDNASKVNFIKYQTSWPGTDPMNAQNKTDVATRVTYTGAGSVGVPYAVMDGAVVKGGGYDGAPGGLTQAKINTEAAITSPFEMKLYHWFNTANDSIYISCTITCSQDITMTTPKLQVSMMEKLITFSSAPGSNGEKAFEHVMRKMYPSASGTTMPTVWTKGQKQTFTFKGAIPTYIYKKSEIATIAWIQDDNTKNVKQSIFNPTANSIPTGITDVAATSINLNAYPNPSNGLMNVYFESAASANYSVRIMNAIGQIVYEENISNFNGIYSKELDLTKFGKGVYILSVTNSAVQQVQKLAVY
jgi:hypothetical protein